uniref:Glycerol kinase 5 n=1 Tax=Syphacia muris TaxID=451379 RepID=A0A0N5AL63_9BILA
MTASVVLPPTKNRARGHVIALDVGTTTLRACLFDGRCRLLKVAERAIKLEFSGIDEEGLRAEIDPDLLWEQLCDVFREIINSVDDVKSIRSLGISCQRSTFICWEKDTGIPCHKFVTWKDCRAREECKRWNQSLTLKALNFFGGILYFFTNQQRFKSARMFAFLSAMVTHRLMVTISQDKRMQKLLNEGKLMFGCLDTWIIHKLTCGRVHLTEPSSASTTGLFDPYLLDWGRSLLSLISFPVSLLPMHTCTAGDVLAVIDGKLFGVQIEIGAVAGDQQAALFASGGLNKGDVSISLGTGSFIDVNTGDQPHASMRGLYPLVAWKFPNLYSYAAEGCSHDTALILKWAQSIGLFTDIMDTSDIAKRAEPSDLYFVPAFGGLQTPINDYSACCAFLGLRPDTSKGQMLRSILESIAFRIFQIWNTVKKEIDFKLSRIVRCCGGVSTNDFVCETISTLINRPLERMKEQSFASARGAALMAGLTAGLWNFDDIPELVCIEKAFYPMTSERNILLEKFRKWEGHLSRCLHFYDNN